MRGLHLQTCVVVVASCGDIPATDSDPAGTTSGSAGTPTTGDTGDTGDSTGGSTGGSTGEDPTSASDVGDDATGGESFGGTGGTGDADPGCGDPDGGWQWAWSSGRGRAIWGSGAADVWVVGPDSGEARRFDGVAWSMHALPPGVPSDITGSAADDVYVAAIDGLVHRFDGVVWQPDGAVMASPTLWAVGPGEVLAVGDGQSFAVRQAGIWTSHPLAVPAPLRGLAGSGPADVFAVGDAGVALHFDGGVWTEIPTDVVADLRGVWPLAPGAAVAVGDAGVVLRLTPGGVAPFPSLPPPYSEHPLLAVWAAGDAAIFIVGVQTLHFFDGSSWHADTLPFFDSAAAVWGVDPHDLFVAGAQHAILHCVAP